VPHVKQDNTKYNICSTELQKIDYRLGAYCNP